LTPIVASQPSYFNGTTALIELIDNLPPINHNTLLVTADVTSLYTAIPQEEGIDIALTAIDNNRDLTPSYTPRKGIIRTFLKFILQYNYFDFMDIHYRQTTGCAMGSKTSGAFANLFMGHLEKSYIDKHQTDILLHKRFMDDILMIYTGGLTKLRTLMTEMQAQHPSIQYTFDYAFNQIPYMDLLIYVDKKRKLRTTIYRKPMDKGLLLHYDSHHPDHIKRNMIYGQAIRRLRMISDPHKLNSELKTFKETLISRGYPPDLIDKQITRARTRHTLTQTGLPLNRCTNHKDRILLKCRYSITNKYTFQRLTTIWNKHITNSTDPRLEKLRTTKPTLVLTRNKRLRDLLTNSRQKPTNH
jgi:hypothetical protein